MASLLAAASGCVGADQTPSGTTRTASAAIQPATNASARVLRTGIWVTHPVPEAAQLKRLENAISRNPYLRGVCLHCGWDEIEKERGRYDFEAMDGAVAAVKVAGKKYQLKIKPGVHTPEFVYKAGAESFRTVVSNPHRDNYGGSAVIPVPWDPVFQEHFSRFIKALGERYSSDPDCLSVVLTCANFQSAEMHLPKRPEDLEKWKSFGDYRGKLLEVYKKYLGEWARAFPRQDVNLHVSQTLDLAPSDLAEPLIQFGIARHPNQFSIQNCQLTGRKEDNGGFSYDLIYKYKDRLHHGYQSLAGFLHTKDRQGTIEMAVLNLVHGDGEYWEVWKGDGMNVEICQNIDSAWKEAKQLGYEKYKAKLVEQGQYRRAEEDTYRPKAKAKRS